MPIKLFIYRVYILHVILIFVNKIFIYIKSKLQKNFGSVSPFGLAKSVSTAAKWAAAGKRAQKCVNFKKSLDLSGKICYHVEKLKLR